MKWEPGGALNEYYINKNTYFILYIKCKDCLCKNQGYAK